MIKRITALILTAVFSLALFCSCTPTQEIQGLHIVCTTFPIYDWTRNILEGCEGITLTLLLDSATDMHSYQATAKDIMTISSADIFIYNGGDSDVWAEDILENSVHSSVKVLNIMKSIGEENLYCQETAHSHDHSHDHHHHTHDEHIWLSPKKAVLAVNAIAKAISGVSQENAEKCIENSKNYSERLQKLSEEIENTVNTAPRNTILVADRFPFLYLAKDYSIDFHAAFMGCSAETEVSATTLIELVETADTLGLHTILITETANKDLAVTVKEHSENPDTKILVLNSIQSIKDKDSVTYIGLMEENISVLKEALS